MIISVSRRCDIPRFRFDWFLERLDAGFVDTANPFNSRVIKRISLLPPAPERKSEDSAELFAFWTRDPSAVLEHAEALERRGYAFFVMITLNAYPALLEPNLPSVESVVQTMKLLSQKTSADRVIWRYDPVFLSDKTDFDFHRRNFARLAASLAGTVKRVIVSVYDEYSGAERRLSCLEKRGELSRLPHYSPAGSGGTKSLLASVRGLLAELAQIGRNEGMEVQSCAEEDLSDCGIKKGACIDGDYIRKNFGIEISGKDRNQRPNCLCAKSTDIGSYGSCPALCVYCYGLRSGVK